MDAYGTWQVGREFGLTANELMVLFYVTLTAPWRSMTWMGTLSDIAAETRMTWRAANTAVKGLIEKGCIILTKPFKQGEFGNGVIGLPLYPRLVKMSKKQQQEYLASAWSQPNANPRQSRANPAPKPRIGTIAVC